MKIVLACMGGMSTSLLVSKMRENAPKEYVIIAMSFDMLNSEAQDADVILLGPQIGFKKNSARELLPNIPIEVIPMSDYGMVNGKKCVELALELINFKKG